MPGSKESKKEQRGSVPEGLEKCMICGEYKGRVKSRNLNWDNVPFKEQYKISEEQIRVSCWCDSIVCPHCGKGTIRRPATNYYVAQDNRIVHVPYFRSSFGCRECGFITKKPKSVTESVSGQKVIRPRFAYSRPLGGHPSHCVAPNWYLVMSRAELNHLFNYERIPEHERQRYEHAFDRYYEILNKSSPDSDERDRSVEEYLAESAVTGCLPGILDRLADLAARLSEEKHRIFPSHDRGSWTQ